jgi:hypothetical protein
MKRLYILFISALVAFSCDDSDNARCISGEVIGYEACLGASIIEVDAQFDVGDSLNLFNKELVNAIQVPGEFATGRGYFAIRNFRSGDEQPPNLEVFCLAMVIPLEIPLYTVINRSDTGCRHQ